MQYRYSQRRGSLEEAAASASAAPPPPPPPAPGAPPLPEVPREVAGLIPEALARQHVIFPLSEKGETVTVAAVNPGDVAVKDRLTFVLNRKVRLVGRPREVILGLIRRHFGEPSRGADPVDSMMQEFTDTSLSLRAAAPMAARAMAAPPHARVRIAAGRPRRGVPEDTVDADFLAEARPPLPPGEDPTVPLSGDTGVFTYVVEEGQRVLMRRPDGTMDVVVGPRRVWKGASTFRPMKHYVAHPGEFLIVRYRDGRQEHLPGPSEVWLDPRVHQDVTREDGLQVAAKEAVVVYSSKEGSTAVQRRVEYGPTLFIPRPGEWLHTFSWHASQGGSKGVVKVPHGLVFQKLWLMPDQMYHDVPDVRTADDAVLVIRLMIFFELIDINRMLDATHDPIGDFTNAATSDAVDFTGRHDFESFKRNTDRLNDLATYRVLTSRAEQCGYRINRVVYRGYGAAERLQQMHDQAIEARTKLQLERATEQQAQDLENFQLDSQLARAGKRRTEQAAEVEHELALARTRQESELRDQEARRAFAREQARLDAEQAARLRAEQEAQHRQHLASLKDMGVDLTAYLTQSRADRVIELRGPGGGKAHVHLDPNREDGARPAAG